MFFLAVVCDEGSGLVRLFHENVFEKFTQNLNNNEKNMLSDQCKQFYFSFLTIFE
jgi:hypothetical protein